MTNARPSATRTAYAEICRGHGGLPAAGWARARVGSRRLDPSPDRTVTRHDPRSRRVPPS